MALQTDYVTVQTYNILKISSPSYISPKLTHAAVARYLCDSYASYIVFVCLVNAGPNKMLSYRRETALQGAS